MERWDCVDGIGLLRQPGVWQGNGSQMLNRAATGPTGALGSIARPRSLQDIGDPFQILVIHIFFGRRAPEMEHQQAHNDDRGYSTQKKDNNSGGHVHDYPLFFISLGAVYDRSPGEAIRETLNMSRGNS